MRGTSNLTALVGCSRMFSTAVDARVWKREKTQGSVYEGAARFHYPSSARASECGKAQAAFGPPSKLQERRCETYGRCGEATGWGSYGAGCLLMALSFSTKSPHPTHRFAIADVAPRCVLDHSTAPKAAYGHAPHHAQAGANGEGSEGVKIKCDCPRRDPTSRAPTLSTSPKHQIVASPGLATSVLPGRTKEMST